MKKIDTYLDLKKGVKFNKLSKEQHALLQKGMLAAIMPVLSLSNAAAQCQGSQASNFTLPVGQANGIMIDVDGDGNDDFNIFDNTAGAYIASLHMTALGSGKVFTAGGSGTVKNYAAGVINGGAGTAQYGGLWWLVIRNNANIYGPWADPYPTSGYIGISKGGNYGFIQLTVHDGAIEGDTNRDFIISIDEAGLATSAGNITAGDCSSLPVELLYFDHTVNENSVDLIWKTASEINNAGFEVQRSTNGRTFTTIGFVEGNGTSYEANDYLFEDTGLVQGKRYYYRLKQIDFDGKFEYSKVINFKLKGIENTGFFSPNPGKNGMTQLRYNTSEEGLLTLKVFDVAGKELHSQTNSVDGGLNKIDLQFGHLGTGVFYVNMKQGSYSSYQKLILSND